MTAKLISDKSITLDVYSKNLIRFNDEIHNVKSERKRKINNSKECKNIKGKKSKNKR